MTRHMPPSPASREDQLARELRYYQRELNEAGAKILRLQEEQQRTFIEAQRSRLIVKMVRELNRLGDDASADTLPERTLDVVVANAMCDCAVLLRERQVGSGVFTVLSEIGPERTEQLPLRLRRPPIFLFTSGSARPEPPASDVVTFLQMPYVLWVYDPGSGCALTIGNRSEGNASRPFEASDQELIETALTVFLDAWARTSTVTADLAASADDTEFDADDACRGIEGGDSLQQELRRGGRIVGVLIVERESAESCSYTPYLRVSWDRGWRALRTYRGKDDRAYSDLNRLRRYIRTELSYSGSVSLFGSNSADLGRFPAVAFREQMAANPASHPNKSISEG